MDNLTNTFNGLENSAYQKISNLVGVANEHDSAGKKAEAIFHNMQKEPPWKQILDDYIGVIPYALRLNGYEAQRGRANINLRFRSANLGRRYPMKIHGGNGNYIVEVSNDLARVPPRIQKKPSFWLQYYMLPLMNEVGHAVTESSGGLPIGQHESLGLEDLFDLETYLVLAKRGLKKEADLAWDTSLYIKSRPRSDYDFYI